MCGNRRLDYWREMKRLPTKQTARIFFFWFHNKMLIFLFCLFWFHNELLFSLENLLISSSSWGIKNRKHCKMTIIFFYLFVFLFKMDFQLFYNHVGPVEERCSCPEGTRILMRYNCQLSCHSTKGNYH